MWRQRVVPIFTLLSITNNFLTLSLSSHFSHLLPSSGFFFCLSQLAFCHQVFVLLPILLHLFLPVCHPFSLSCPLAAVSLRNQWLCWLAQPSASLSLLHTLSHWRSLNPWTHTHVWVGPWHHCQAPLAFTSLSFSSPWIIHPVILSALDANIDKPIAEKIWDSCLPCWSSCLKQQTPAKLLTFLLK